MEGSGVGSGGYVVHFDVHFYAVKSFRKLFVTCVLMQP